jgi:hypothetical protein
MYVIPKDESESEQTCQMEAQEEKNHLSSSSNTQ